MTPPIVQMHNEPYAVYERARFPWQVLVKQDGNETQCIADFLPDREGGAIFTLLPLKKAGVKTPLLHIRLAAQAPAEVRSSAPNISVQCHIPAVIRLSQHNTAS
jgi:hypothetical protein